MGLLELILIAKFVNLKKNRKQCDGSFSVFDGFFRVIISFFISNNIFLKVWHQMLKTSLDPNRWFQ